MCMWWGLELLLNSGMSEQGTNEELIKISNP